nr:MAG TPA: HTH-type transcriptional regulator [Caudoviricetes sp.]
MINKKRRTPRCPYCGGEMEMHEPLDWIIYWRCATCAAMAPTCETREAAYKAALRRDECVKNHVMSLAEIDSRVGAPVCVEDYDEDGDFCYRIRTVTRQDYESHRIYFNSGRTWYDANEYLSTWRCWLREPTREEMEATPWEGEEEDE